MRFKMMNLRAVLLLCASLGWWSYFYPELAFNRETVRILTVDEEGNPVEIEDAETRLALYRKLFEAEDAQICFRSKLLEEINSLMEVLKWENIIQN